MVKRQSTKQKESMEYLETKYLFRKNVSRHDLSVIQSPMYFPKNRKKDRHYNNGVEHAKADLRLLHFFLLHLKPHYRLKILESEEFQSVLDQVIDIGVTKFHSTIKEEKDRELAIALQMLENSLGVIIKNMPKAFRKPLVNAASPLSDLLYSISEFGRQNNIKTIPQFKENPILHYINY